MVEEHQDMTGVMRWDFAIPEMFSDALTKS